MRKDLVRPHLKSLLTLYLFVLEGDILANKLKHHAATAAMGFTLFGGLIVLCGFLEGFL